MDIIPSGPMDLFIFSLNISQCDPPPCLPCSGLFHWSQGFLKASIPSKVKDKDKEGIQYLSLFYVLSHQISCHIQQWAHSLPSLSFTAHVLSATFLVALCIPKQIQLHMGFAFPSPKPAWIVSVSLPYHLPLLLPVVYVFFELKIFQELFFHLYRPPATVAFYPTWTRWSLKINQLSWNPLLSKMIFHGILPSKLPEEAKACSLKI